MDNHLGQIGFHCNLEAIMGQMSHLETKVCGSLENVWDELNNKHGNPCHGHACIDHFFADAL